MTPKLSLIVLFWMIAVPAFAQSGERLPVAPVRIGALHLYPTIAVTNLGVDSNVFNDPDQLRPKSDFTFTVTPATDLGMRLGRVRLAGSLKEDFVYYQTYANQRSANGFVKGGLQFPLNRVTLSGGASYLSTRERPGFEIDVRTQRNEVGVNGAAEFRALPKTFVGLRGTRTKIDYDEGARFLDSNLHFQLNRTETMGALTTRYRLTPLTSLTLDLGVGRDRFEFASFRDSDSASIAAGVKFEQPALLKGSASFGYRDFQPLSPDTAPYKGGIGAVDLSTTLGSTKLGLQASRNVQYSYDLNQPYYVLTGGFGSIAQHLYGPVDLVGRFGAGRLDYQNRVTIGPPPPKRIDYIHSYGGGLGYRVARRMRLGVNVDQYRRTSDVELRRYNGLIFGTSVTYGF